MFIAENEAIRKMCPKRSQFTGQDQNCVATRCMAWRREEDFKRNKNTGIAFGYCAEYPEPKNFNVRSV